ncbi:MAG: hypothetical protein KDD69_03710 [Bdellovibrionales bacterium]|nr:hypothetical protein [Bdellovibrionales bacterium]
MNRHQPSTDPYSGNRGRIVPRGPLHLQIAEPVKLVFHQLLRLVIEGYNCPPLLFCPSARGHYRALREKIFAEQHHVSLRGAIKRSDKIEYNGGMWLRGRGPLELRDDYARHASESFVASTTWHKGYVAPLFRSVASTLKGQTFTFSSSIPFDPRPTLEYATPFAVSFLRLNNEPGLATARPHVFVRLVGKLSDLNLEKRLRDTVAKGVYPSPRGPTQPEAEAWLREDVSRLLNYLADKIESGSSG